MADREFTNINGIKVCDQTARDNIPTKTSQLENDSNFVTDSVVDGKIANAQLGGGGEVDLSSYAKITDLPTKTSQLTNDSGYITNVPDEYITETELNAKGYATTSQIPTVPTNVSAFTNDANYASETFVTNKIAEASLSGGEVDLSGYVTKETGNANQITFADGQTFQAKLDAGTLKGDKGDTGATGPKGEQGIQGEQGPKGDKGADGLTTSISLNGVTYTQENGVITLPNITSGGDTPSVAHIEPEELDMPKVFFNGDKPTTKDSVYATIEYVSKTEHFKGYVDIKCQGTSSMAYPKKNYTIKMFTDETMVTKLKKDFKGWGKQSKFCLKANYIDHSHARNIVSAKLWGQVVKSRSDFDTLPEELKTSPNYGAVDGFPIKVYYNNTYEGVYTWNIPKDGWMNNMNDTLDTHCILCGEEYDSGCFRSANASLWSDELHDVMPANIVTSFNNFQNFVINSSNDEFKTGLSQYADVNSLIDYYIFQYVTCGLDSMGKNQLFFTYDGVKWIASSYDMDSTFGMYWNGQNFVSAEYRMQEDYESGINTTSYNNKGNLLYVRMEELFYDEIKVRYAELRAGVLSYANIVNEFERFMDVIGKDLYAEDLTIYTGIPSGSTNNIQQIRNYTRDRLTYVDTQIEALRELIPCTGIVLSADTLSFTTTDTQTLSVVVSPDNTTDTVTWSVSPSGIVTIKNGVITPISNGTCTITAACGSYNDTCAVTVSGISESGVNPNLVFQVNSASMNTVDNTLTDNIAGISATLTGNPTVSGNQIAFTASDSFSFDISSLNLTSSNRTFRIKFTPTTLDGVLRNVIGIGSSSNNWDELTTSYVDPTKLILQHGRNGLGNVTVGSPERNYNVNRLSTAPVTGQEYELVISEHTNGNVRWFIDGTLVQNGTTTLFNPLYISNTEGNNKFVGSYSLIEVYNEYCNDYTEFTNMVNN